MKTQTLFRTIFGVAFIAVLLSVVSCDAANNPSALVGQWVGVSRVNKGEVWEFLSDGTGVFTEGSRGIAITWKTENGRFYITASGGAQSMNYKVQGSVLTFTKDNDEVKYVKCKKDCKESAKEYVEKATAAALKAIKKSSFTDSRDNKTYKTVKLDDKTWMSENLNYNANGSKCYENQESNCQKYGRLYNWETAKSACPKGWHLPSDAEWQTLVDFASNIDGATGKVLKASSGWENNGNGEDAFGFSALPGGYGNSSGVFYYVGEYGYWWSSTEGSASYAYSRRMRCDFAGVDRYFSDEAFLYSVRCVQD